ncbi:MAG: PAS domain-containing sensor histidine kinase [Candidatus Saccharimonadales bacterium]
MPVKQTKKQVSISNTRELDRYRLLVETIKDYAIFHLDTTGHIASWNTGAQRFKGYLPDEIIGKHFSIFYTPIDKQNKKPEWELEVAMKEGRVEDESWRVRKDGTRFWANVIITALFDTEGNHIGFAKVTRDLTERKKYEDNLYKANVRLEASYKELQALSATKDEFISLASHQLRTPATGVKQYLNLLLEGYAGPLSELQMDYLHKAYASNDRQIEIVNDLLRVAQVDAGKVILVKTVTDIGELVADVIDEQVDSFKGRNQGVAYKSPAKTIRANIDKVRLRMVIENLIDNASKYTPDKGNITVSVREESGDVYISIEDNGVGIAKKDQSKIFEKFGRANNKLTQKVSGSGLGLYWADKIIKLHDGAIELESQKGKGTAFTIRLPEGDI